MAIELPELPYGFSELEPYISEETLTLHYNKHHRGYVEKTNKLILGTPYEDLSLEDIIARTAHQRGGEKKIYENAAQAWNHTFFWNCLCNDHNQRPSPALSKVIQKSFGSFDSFSEKFSKTAEEIFGSGWAWLVKTSQDRLEIVPCANADTPIADDLMPLLAIDVWEHAYYVDYRNDRKQYIKNLWKIMNWEFVESNFQTHFIAAQPHPTSRAEYFH